MKLQLECLWLLARMKRVATERQRRNLECRIAQVKARVEEIHTHFRSAMCDLDTIRKADDHLVSLVHDVVTNSLAFSPE